MEVSEEVLAGEVMIPVQKVRKSRPLKAHAKRTYKAPAGWIVDHYERKNVTELLIYLVRDQNG